MDARIPEISAHRFLKPFLEDTLPGLAGPNVIRILAEPDMKGTRIADAVSTASAAIGAGGAREAIIAVGPEGGWMPREISMLEELHGFSRITLGPRILKTDAAVIVLLGLLHDALQRENVGCI
jgi:RsmE family RNA methyltransferase